VLRVPDNDGLGLKVYHRQTTVRRHAVTGRELQKVAAAAVGGGLGHRRGDGALRGPVGRRENVKVASLVVGDDDGVGGLDMGHAARSPNHVTAQHVDQLRPVLDKQSQRVSKHAVTKLI